MAWENEYDDIYPTIASSTDQQWLDFAQDSATVGRPLTPEQQARIAIAQANLVLTMGGSPGPAVAANRAVGIPDTTRMQRQAQGIQGGSNQQQGQKGGDCGCNGNQAGFCTPGNMRTTQLYPATRVPKQYTMTHQRVKGYHNCYVGSTLCVVFTRKASANAFCRAWNEMMKHLGSAMTFDIPTLSSVFLSVIDGGSGAWGIQYGFDPPMHGVNGTTPPPVA